MRLLFSTLCLRVSAPILLMVMAAWPSDVRNALSELNAPDTTATSDTTAANTMAAQVQPNPTAPTHPCEDSLYLAWKSTPAKNLTVSELKDYARRHANCQRSASGTKHQQHSPISRNTKATQGQFTGFHVLAWVGAFSTVMSTAILVSIDDECEGITDIFQTTAECREEAEDARGTAGGLAIISFMATIIGVVGALGQ